MMFAGASNQARKNQAAQQWQCASLTQKYNLACSKSCHQASCDFSLRKPTSTRELILGLSDPPPTSAPSKRSCILGLFWMGLKPNPRQDLVPWGKFLCLFSSHQLPQQSVLTSLRRPTSFSPSSPFFPSYLSLLLLPILTSPSLVFCFLRVGFLFSS